MAKLRKTLGHWDDPSVRAMMALIDTQSKESIRRWCLDYAAAHMLPIFERRCPGDDRPRRALTAAAQYLDGQVKFPEVKRVILQECHAAARELAHDPVAQAAARACGQGAAVVHTLSHSLGLYFYGAAAVAYDKLGLSASAQAYDEIAQQVCEHLRQSLQAVAVADEPNPAKIKWYC